MQFLLPISLEGEKKKQLQLPQVLFNRLLLYLPRCRKKPCLDRSACVLALPEGKVHRRREVPPTAGRASKTQPEAPLFLVMEALRAAGRAVLRSPSLARHRLGVARLRRHRQG